MICQTTERLEQNVARTEHTGLLCGLERFQFRKSCGVSLRRTSELVASEIIE